MADKRWFERWSAFLAAFVALYEKHGAYWLVGYAASGLNKWFKAALAGTDKDDGS